MESEVASLKVAEHFVIAGMGDEPQLYREPDTTTVLPIQDIQVVLPNEQELCPYGWEFVTSPGGQTPANFNWVNPTQCPIYVIIQRGYDKKPISDIDVYFAERKDKKKIDYLYLNTSINGKPVSLNGHLNRSAKHVYLGYRRSPTCNFTEAVTLIELASFKRDIPKLGVRSIRLHKSTFAAGLFLAYQRTKLYITTGLFTETLIDRFPRSNGDVTPLDLMKTPSFCLPLGVQVEWFRNKDPKPPPQFSSFVLTNERGRKMYGSSVMFYELIIGANKVNELSSNYPKGPELFPYATKSICVLSRWPSFFDTLRRWLMEIYEMSVSGLALTVPLERMISNLLFDVPFPTPAKPTVELFINKDTLRFEQPLMTQIPISGGTFATLIQCLQIDHILSVFYQLLLEENILLVSSSTMKLTAAAEALCSLLYPFKWMSPYIPLLPHRYGEELFADGELDCPLPFVIGMREDFLDLYSIPNRVTQVYLDTDIVILPETASKIVPHMPRAAVNQLEASLQGIINKFDNTVPGRELELSIQEAFLRFQAHLLSGYTDCLLPVLEHKDRNLCSSDNLFDIERFISSREEYERPFYRKLLGTQMFDCFVINRSFISNSDETLEFFDGCMERLEEDTPFLRETDSRLGVTVVVQMDRMYQGLKQNKLYSYPVFVLDKELFYAAQPNETSLADTSVISLRTKVEKQKMTRRVTAAKSKSASTLWAKCLLQHVYCVWYLYLPSLISILEAGPEQKAQLQLALETIKSLKLERKTNLEEVCYRILISLSGFYGYPKIAMETFTHMKEEKISISAVTYGHYHRAVLDCSWNIHTGKNWRLLRLYVTTLVAFKRYRKNPGSLESIQSSDNKQTTDSPTDSNGRKVGLSDSGIGLDNPLSALKSKSEQTSEGTPTEAKHRGHVRSRSDISMLSVQNNHHRQLSDDVGSKTISRVKSPRFKRNSLMGKSVKDRSITRSNTNSFRKTMTASSSTYSVDIADDDPGDFYRRDYEKPDPLMFTLPPDYSDNLDPDAVLRIRIWSSFTCTSCSRRMYDEQILSGFGNEESNLNTTCTYCQKPSVAQLNIEGTYSDSKSNKRKFTRSKTLETPSLVDANSIHISLEGEEDNIESGNISFAMPEPIRKERKNRSGSVLSLMNPRATRKQDESKSSEKFEIPYLSPIVLRKEVECVLESDGPNEMIKSNLVESHTILFWNMLWWFCREELDSGLTLCIPAAFKDIHPQKKLCQTVILSTEWTDSPHGLYKNFEGLSQNKELSQCAQLWRIIEHTMQDDLQSACNLFCRHRTQVHHEMYRELLFLSAAYKNDFSPLLFDDDYESCLTRIPAISQSYVKMDDKAISQSDRHCRQLFSWLGLEV